MDKKKQWYGCSLALHESKVVMKNKVEIVPRKYKDKAREQVIQEINDEFTSDSRKDLLIKQLKLYDKVMGYK